MHAKMPLRHPVDGLDIAQPARRFLDVGLQVVFGIAVAFVALPLLIALGAEESRRWPDFCRPGPPSHLSLDAWTAGDGAGFHQIGGNGDVIASGFCTVAQGAGT